jgi:SAM-dependent methyltransferase
MVDADLTAITIQTYDDTAEGYAAKTMPIDTAPQILRFSSSLKKGDLILDSGCGPGRDAKRFNEAGYNVIGIDLSRKLLAYAENYAPKAVFLKRDVRDLAIFPDEIFDGVWAMSSLMHLPKSDFLPALMEHYRVLKEGGPFYLSLKRGIGEKLEHDARFGGAEKFFAYYGDEEVTDILKDTPFKIVHFDTSTTGDFNYATHPWMDIYLRKG